jgi:RNA polymerase sigma factor (sigma-70 family)
MADARVDPLFEPLGILSKNRTDDGGWRALYKTLWPFVYSGAYRLLRGRTEEAEQASQDVFVRIACFCPFKSLSPNALRSYAWATLRNVVRDRIRAAAKERAVPVGEMEHLLGTVDPGVPEQAEAQDALERILEHLDPLDAKILRLRIEGATLPEIAGGTGLSYTAAGARLHRLRRRLRGLFDKSL